MKVRNSVQSQAIKCLYESFPPDMISRIARMVLPGYNLYERTGFPESIPIPPQVASDRIVRDLVEADRFLPLVELLIQIDSQGYMGREYPIIQLGDLVKKIVAEGYVLDKTSGLFMENALERSSPDWGRLASGEEKQFAFLRLDIAANSILVRDNPKKAVAAAYAALREIVGRSVSSRNGRVWYWEGDGCLCAFLFGQKEASCILSGMQITNEIFLFNRKSNPLSSPLRIRLAAHSGPAVWQSTESELKKNESIREIDEIENKYTLPETMAATSNLFLGLDRVINESFSSEKAFGPWKLRDYAVRLEEA